MYTVVFLQLLELLMVVQLLELLMVVQLLELLMVDGLRIVMITESRVRSGVK